MNTIMKQIWTPGIHGRLSAGTMWIQQPVRYLGSNTPDLPSHLADGTFLNEGWDVQQSIAEQLGAAIERATAGAPSAESLAMSVQALREKFRTF
jgi:hypothetical protein